MVITGAASGIGRALARRWARAGARLGLLDRDREGVEAVAAELSGSGDEVIAVPCDVTSPEQCRQAVGAVLEAHGGIDVLVNNAGITHLSRFSETDAGVVRRVMDVNLFGALHCTQAALDALRARRGQVVVISSVAGFAPLAGRCAYSASKHALHGLFETLRSEERESGVGVTMVCPGFTRTAIERHALGGDGEPARGPRRVFGRSADPDRVADAIYRGARRRRRLIVLSPVGKLSRLLWQVAPRLYERAMARSMLAANAGSGPGGSEPA